MTNLQNHTIVKKYILPIVAMCIAALGMILVSNLTSSSPAASIPVITPTATTIPSPTPIPVVRFAVIGDFGRAGPDLKAVADLIDSWQVDFIITTGDNNYPDGAQETIDSNIGQYFHAYISPYIGEYGPGADINRFFPSLGNHDWRAENAQPYLDYFELPGNERYYEFEWDFIHFFVLDSDSDEPDGIEKDSIQGEWLKQAMATSIAPWKIVYFHHSPYSSGNHGSDQDLQWPFPEWGADAVITGHDHLYERLEIDDTLYLVNGLGGRSRYNFHTLVPGSQVRYNEEYGAVLAVATPFRIEFQFVNIGGEVIDEFQLPLQQ
jgi:hypothetical protein